MPRALLPSQWQTERLRVKDSTPYEARELQRINDAVPQTRTWMRVEGQPTPSMLMAVQEGVLPPIPSRSKDYFRLQSIRLAEAGALIGFVAVYHGFPEDDIFWINTLTLHPKFQGRGYGPELLHGLIENVRQLGSYTRMRSYVPLNNWRSLRMCVKAGLDRMVEVAVVGDRTLADQAAAHVLVEKSLAE